MQYALLIYNQPDAFDSLPPEQRAAVSAEYAAVTADPHVVGGAQPQPLDTATTVRVKDGEPLITDGPFAETKEVFGGYYLVSADDLDVALAIAERVPAARMGGSVEVRPIVPQPA